MVNTDEMVLNKSLHKCLTLFLQKMYMNVCFEDIISDNNIYLVERITIYLIYLSVFGFYCDKQCEIMKNFIELHFFASKVSLWINLK